MEATTAPIHPWVATGGDRLGFGIIFLTQPDWGATLAFAQTVEALGFDSLWVGDHPGVTGTATWTTLAAIAGATRTLPSLTANMCQACRGAVSAAVCRFMRGSSVAPCSRLANTARSACLHCLAIKPRDPPGKPVPAGNKPGRHSSC